MRAFVDTSILDLTDRDRAHRELQLTPDQIVNDLAAPTVLWLLSEVRHRLRANQDAFFDGTMGLPPGLSGASPKESYMVGLVSFAKEVLGLVHELQTRAQVPESQPKAKFKDPFAVEVPE